MSTAHTLKTYHPCLSPKKSGSFWVSPLLSKRLCTVTLSRQYKPRKFKHTITTMLYEIHIHVTRNISTNQRTANAQEGYYHNAKNCNVQTQCYISYCHLWFYHNILNHCIAYYVKYETKWNFQVVWLYLTAKSKGQKLPKAQSRTSISLYMKEMLPWEDSGEEWRNPDWIK